jgi:glycerol transport system ATP-binding protein
VFQFPVIYDTMTVAQNLAFPLKNRGLDEARIRARVTEVAELLELTPDLGRRARGLTADAKQKISLGRGLVRDDVAAVLFDEPLTVIDPALKWHLRSKLKALHRELRRTMIYVTHDQNEALTFADTVVVMHDGRVVQSASPAELFERPAHTFVGYFIGSPGMNVLPSAVDGHRARLGEHTLDLGNRYDVPAGTASVEVGFRPEFATIARSGDGLPVVVERIEDHGRTRFAKVRLTGGGESSVCIAARLPEGVDVESGQAARLKVDPKGIHVYLDQVRVPPSLDSMPAAAGVRGSQFGAVA